MHTVIIYTMVRVAHVMKGDIMGNICKPMLAATLEDIADVKYPCYCTAKLDGMRCLVVDGVAVSRNFKPFPNKHVRKLVSTLPEGFDGEIIVGKLKFNEIMHLIGAHDGEPEFTYMVFDYLKMAIDKPYTARMEDLKKVAVPKWVTKLIPIKIDNEEELLAYEKKCLAEGYEGVMLRTPDSPYKFGRSGVRESFLLKLKRFTDSEAEVLELNEQMENTNVKVDNALGHGERSSAKAGMVPKGTLGAFLVKDLKTGVEFSIGSGMNDELRATVWKHKNDYIGKIIKYKSQKSGEKDAPRFPVFLGFRDINDM